MTDKNLGVGLVVVLIIAIIGVVTPTGQRVVERVVEHTGAAPGPDIYDEMRFHGDTIDGGMTTSSSTAGNVTFSTAQMCNYAIVTHAPSATSATFSATTVSSSTLASNCLPEPGMSREFTYRNTGATATTSTITAGTGITLLEHDGGDVVIPGGEQATFFMQNVDDSTVTIKVTSERDAD